ncbi:MAG: excisionase family DNA-binding protein [Planctomycetes bacterium]|nr:excisionase family DNA-binding protein [Planctomycetota bacterium]
MVRLFAAVDRAVQVPAEAINLFLEIPDQMVNGNAVTLLWIHAGLTTQQAADILNLSRPHLIKLIADKKIPHKQVGTHRRLRADDIIRFKAQSIPNVNGRSTRLPRRHGNIR